MKNLQFTIKNLGSIINGEFEHKPLTIFCGPNNNGKTWAMYALYHFYTFINKQDSMRRVIEFNCVKKLSEADFLQINIKSLVEKNQQDIINNFNKIISKSAPEFLNCSQETLAEFKFSLNFTHISIGENLKKEILSIEKKLTDTKISVDNKRFNLNIFLQENLFVFNDVFLMPAERNGLHLFYNELSSKRTALLHHASQENIDISKLLRDVSKSRYAKPIADYIDWLNYMPEFQKHDRSEFNQFAKQIEKDLAGGTFKIDNKTNAISFKPYKKRGGKDTQNISLHITSSAVKSLFGLWLYLKYQAEKGDILMIDEPELHIHPENQIKIARLLVQLVNAGLKVVISTHSDYIIREFNSMIMLNQQTKLQKQYKYKKDEAIDCQKVAAYLFDDNTIKPSDIVADDGIEAKTFDEVINQQNEVNNDIYHTLQSSKDE
ncbi:hypothetical protein SPONN_2409 [uncultured Candidatus Thioglobus sp.]|nr:hypothetical protein SPONN_2409 [uncultured Candidatus Thioglobus sp.]